MMVSAFLKTLYGSFSACGGLDAGIFASADLAVAPRHGGSSRQGLSDGDQAAAMCPCPTSQQVRNGDVGATMLCALERLVSLTISFLRRLV